MPRGSAAFRRPSVDHRPHLAGQRRRARQSRRRIDGVRQAIAAAGASILYLPPYPPDLNPIEQLFAKLKALLRKVAARTKEDLWSTIGHLLDAYPSTECSNYFRHCSSVRRKLPRL